jgi:hypothetical protein
MQTASSGPQPKIPPTLRHSIMDALIAAGVEWHGRLTDRDFLQRLYDLVPFPDRSSVYPPLAL